LPYPRAWASSAGALDGDHRAERSLHPNDAAVTVSTEPLSDSQREAIGWGNRQGISDMGNQFHYYRPTADGASCTAALLDGRTTPATQLGMMRRHPVPFPPEPLRTLDRLGLGFDS
jgi:hypothetical protein